MNRTWHGRQIVLTELQRLCWEEQRRLYQSLQREAASDFVKLDAVSNIRRQLASLDRSERHLAGIGKALEMGL